MKSDIKSLFVDVLTLYKNFIHWNISKIIIFLYSIILGFILAIPLIFIFFIYSLFSVNQFSDILNSFFNGIYMNGLMGNILYIFVLLFFAIGYLFSFIMLININNNYLLGNKLSYTKNLYFNYKLIFKHLLLTLLNLVIFLIPIFIFIFLLSIFILMFGGIDGVISILTSSSTNGNIFSLVSLIMFVLLLLAIFYIFYRIIFSYFFLIEDNKKTEKIYNLVIESFNRTKGFVKFLRFIIYIIIFLFFFLPFSFINLYINGNYEDLNNYISYMNLKEEDKDALKQISSYKYNTLEVKYSGVEVPVINSLQYKFYYLSIIFSIIEFLVISGVFSMLLTSFYNRNIKQ